ncbi:MAG: ABC transporter permease [Gemmatimonadaceae bacterium]
MTAFDRDRWRRGVQLPRAAQRVRTEVDAELQFHIDGRIEELVAQGLSREDAERQARKAFGDMHRIGAEVEEIDRDVVRRLALSERLADIVRDTRHALRGMAKQPLVSTIVVLTLALGIGANTAVFSAVNTVLLHPVAVPWIDRLVAIRDDLPGLGLRNTELSPAETRDLIQRRDLFTSVAGYAFEGLTLTGTDEAQRLTGAETLGDFFGTFGAHPLLGRLYRPEDSENGSHRVVVLSHELWQRLSGDSSILGTPLQLNGFAFEVIGVLPPDFHFPRTAQIWLPFPVTPQNTSPEQRGSLYVSVVGRVKPGISPAQLSTALADEARRWHERFTYDPKFQHTVVQEPFADYLAGKLRPILLILLGAVGLVLLIACSNVASLQLVRTLGRTREIAVRSALGAGRWAIARQLLIENLVLYVAGGLLGLLLGRLALATIARWSFGDLAQLGTLRLDGTVLAFTALVTLLAGLVFEIAPALRATRVDAQEALKEQGRGSSLGLRGQRFIRASVVAQTSIALVLLLGATLTIRSMRELLRVDPGFQAQNVTTMRAALAGSRYPNGKSRAAFFEGLAERLRSVPRIIAVGMVDGVPFSSAGTSSPLAIRGMAELEGQPERHANMRVISGDYFKAMGIPLVRGRVFDASDAVPPDSGSFRFSAIIDEAVARKYFGDVDPIGKVISQGPDAVVVGVVGAVRNGELGQLPYPTVYYPHRQYNWYGSLYVTVRSTLDPTAVLGQVRAAVRQLDENVPLYDVQQMSDRVEESLGQRRLALIVLGGFATLAVMLATLGIYGVISYGVSQRTREIGIRIALGATPSDVLRREMWSGVTLALGGVSLGAIAFLALGQVLSALLYGVGARDPATIISGVVVLLVVSMAASFWPARRAARVPPLEALRTE